MRLHTVRRRTMRVDGVLFGCVELGDPKCDKTFVLVHGIGMSERYFMPLAEQLAREARVLVLVLPGHGSLPKPSRALSITDYAVLLEHFLQNERLKNPVLVGNSMGCQIVVELLVLSSRVTGRAVLIGPVINTKERTFIQQTLRLFQDGFHEPLRVNWIVNSDYFRCGVVWYFKTFPHMLHYPIEDKVRHIKAKTLIIRGEKDPIAPKWWVTHLAERIPNATVAEIPRIGHIAMFKQAKEVARQCLEL